MSTSGRAKCHEWSGHADPLLYTIKTDHEVYPRRSHRRARQLPGPLRGHAHGRARATKGTCNEEQEASETQEEKERRRGKAGTRKERKVPKLIQKTTFLQNMRITQTYALGRKMLAGYIQKLQKKRGSRH
jgi:hypothetical protein